METLFTPFLSFGGGMLIGVSALILLATNGRIAGISGILSRVLPPSIDKANIWQGLLFVLGLLVAAPIFHLVSGNPPEQVVSDNFLQLAAAGILVGFGSVYGNGCTSGHGVCGISRLSIRSIIATVTFIFTGIVTVSLLRHVFGI